MAPDRVAPLLAVDAQRRTMPTHCFATAVFVAGRVRRPVFSVMSASFNPRPSPQRRFSFGTRTRSKVRRPFWMPL